MAEYNTWPVINPFNWGYNGNVRQYIGSQGTTKLQLQADKTNDLVNEDSKHQIDFADFVSKNVPGLKDGANFQLNPMLFTGILQTMYLGSADYTAKFPVFYGREIVKFSDDGVCTADWVMNAKWKPKYRFDPKTLKYNKQQFKEDDEKTHPQDWPRLHPRTRYLSDDELKEVHEEDNRPLVVVLHGLAGGSHEPIIRSLTDHLSHAGDGKFQVVVLNTRGCARSKITTRCLFTAFHILDTQEFLIREKKRNPNRKIYAVGCSFGATMLANYLGFVGKDTPLSAAVTLSNPWDMVLAAYKISQDFWSKRVFSQTITQFLVRMVKVNMKELEVPEGTKPLVKPTPQHPQFDQFTRSNLDKAFNMKVMGEFDEMFTAPALGFDSAFDYYKSASSVNRFKDIAIPLLSINSSDDPVVGADHVPMTYINENPNVLVIETDLGGHLAYLQRDGDSWATRQISQFFDKFDELVE